MDQPEPRTDARTDPRSESPTQSQVEPEIKPLRRAGVVNRLTDLYERPDYLEVGVSQGVTFRRVRAARKVAVDPAFRFDVDAWAREMPEAEFHPVTSDEYFAARVAPDRLFDVIYLDGLHTFEQTLRDLTNALHHLQPRGVVVVDDTRPTSYAASLPDQAACRAVRQAEGDTRLQWMGDVYKLVYFVETFYPSLSYGTVLNNHGQTVFWRGRREPRPRPSVGEVDRLQYEDVVLDAGGLRLGRFGDIRRRLRADLGL